MNIKNKLLFSLSYKNREIYYAELQCLSLTDPFEEKLKETADLIGKLTSPESVIYHLKDSTMNKERIYKLAREIKNTETRYQKLAFTGIYGWSRYILKRALKKSDIRKDLRWTIENDYQEAKNWITGF